MREHDCAEIFCTPHFVSKTSVGLYMGRRSFHTAICLKS